ncbi:phosphoribosylglycinamide formyltransferase [Rummeliibacillus sp. TYF-LIM-RU47]|uniref:phosphoribosylglycinamide formyltransferase n=1 Tax=Rummeliibacillus sp. TYF-LIM-RU47 TaxID=2608406 RepID=UPI00123C332A|nr:phosphoribosylglycinamide formyltransferase [Rummeliibacillus sp. TYF-LIM-RU47]
MKKIAIFASGNGSNFQSIMEAEAKKELKIKTSLLVCDNHEAYVLQRAQKLGIPIFCFNPKEYEDKKAYEEVILEHLLAEGVEYLILAGYMRLIGPTILREYEGRIINIHPSLLPAFPGKDAIGQALDAKAKETGVTVHYVDEGMDTGPVIAQESVRIYENDTEESLKKCIQIVEHRLYPSVLKELFQQEHVNIG